MTVSRCGEGRRILLCMADVSGGFEWSGEGAAACDRGVGRRRSGEAVRSGTRLLIRRLRGWVGAKFQRPRAIARGYTRPQLRCSIRMAGRRRLAGQPTSTAASQLSLKSRQCGRIGFLNCMAEVRLGNGIILDVQPRTGSGCRTRCGGVSGVRCIRPRRFVSDGVCAD